MEEEMRRRRIAILGGFQMQNALSNSFNFEDDFKPKRGGGSAPKNGVISSVINRNISSLSGQGSQAVVVKIASFASGGARASSLLEYISREGKEGDELPLENELGFYLQGGSEINELVQEWSQDFSGRNPSKDVIGFEVEFPKSVNLTDEQALILMQDALDGHHHLVSIFDDENGVKKVSVVSLLAGQNKSRLYVDGKRGQKFQDKINAGLSGDDKISVAVFGVGHGQDSVKKYANVGVDKHGSMVDETGKIYRNKNQVEALSNKWKHKMQTRKSRDVMHLILSSKPGTNKNDFVNASRDYLKMTYPNHQYQFACHEDRGHFHIHAAVKVVGANRERLAPNKEDLRQWRENMAVCAQAHGINMHNKDIQKSNYPSYKLKDKYMAKAAIQDNTTRQLVAEIAAKSSLVSKLFGKKKDVIQKGIQLPDNKILYPKQFEKSKNKMDAHKDSTSLRPIYSREHYINLSYSAAIHRGLSDQDNGQKIVDAIERQQEAHKEYALSDDAHKLINGISNNIVKLSEYKDRIYSVDGDELEALEKSQAVYQKQLSEFVELNKFNFQHELFDQIVTKGIKRMDKQFMALKTQVQFKEANPEFGFIYKTAEAQIKATNEDGRVVQFDINENEEENTMSEVVKNNISEQVKPERLPSANVQGANIIDPNKSARWNMAQQIKRENAAKDQNASPTEKTGNARRDMAQQIKRDNAAKDQATASQKPSNPRREMAQKIKRENENKSKENDLER